MTTTFRQSFVRDLKRIKDKVVLERVAALIEQVEAAVSTADLSDVKKLAGAGDYYRIRTGDYRLGIAIQGDKVEFIRCLPRRDLYKYFP
jgi:mRNA interferase RelE/StbE